MYTISPCKTCPIKSDNWRCSQCEVRQLRAQNETLEKKVEHLKARLKYEKDMNRRNGR